MKLAVFGIVVLVVACKSEPRSAPSAGSSTGSSAVVAIEPPVPDLPGELWFVEDGPPHTLVRIAGGKRLAIAAPLFPSSERLPDGRLVAIRSRGDGSPDSEQLVLVAADGTQMPIGPAAAQVRNPVVAGASIIAAIQTEGRSELHRIDIATGSTTRLTDNKEGNFHPVRLGPDAIAFVSSRDGDSEIYRMPVAGGAQQRLTIFHKDDWDPVPSPDGKTIAFTSDREGPPRIFLIATDGTKFRRLTTRDDRTVEEDQAQWSPDGTKIAYVIRASGQPRLIVRTVASGEETSMTPPSTSDTEPSWAPDGAWVAVVRAIGRESQLIAIASDGTGAPIPITERAAQLPRWFAR